MLENANFHHLGYAVANIEAVKVWQACGYEIERDWTRDDNQNVMCCLLQHERELRVESLTPIKNLNKQPLSSVLRRGGGLHHIAYEIRNGDVPSLFRHSFQKPITTMKYAPLLDSNVIFFIRLNGSLVEYVVQN